MGLEPSCNIWRHLPQCLSQAAMQMSTRTAVILRFNFRRIYLQAHSLGFQVPHGPLVRKLCLSLALTGGLPQFFVSWILHRAHHSMAAGFPSREPEKLTDDLASGFHWENRNGGAGSHFSFSHQNLTAC